MAANKVIRFGPTALTTVVTNIINPPTTTGGTGLAGTNSNTYVIVKHIRVVNKSGSAGSYSMWIGGTGASAAGTEFMGTSNSVAANSSTDWYGQVRLDTADYLTANASANTTITFQAEGEIGLV